MLYRGIGVPVTKESFVNYLKLAADSGLAGGQCPYGVALAHGVNLPGDKEIAAHYYKLAADNRPANSRAHSPFVTLAIMFLRNEVFIPEKPDTEDRVCDTQHTYDSIRCRWH